MDPDLLDPHLVYAKTAAGEEAMLQRTRVVQRNTRMVLILVDGNATVAELCEKTGNAQLTCSALLELESDGFIERRVEADSVWKHDKNAASAPRKPPAPEEVSEFSTFGNLSQTEGLSSPPQDKRSTRIIPFPGGYEGSPQITPSIANPSLPAPDSGTVFLARDQAAPPPSLAPVLGAGPSESVPPNPPAPSAEEEQLVRPASRPYGRRLPVAWPMVVMLGMFLCCALLTIVVLIFPYAHFIPEVEEALAQSSGQPARIEAMRASFYPRPGLLLKQVRLGIDADGSRLEIAEVALQPLLSSLWSSKIVLRDVELSGLTLSAEAVGSLSRTLLSFARDSAHVGIEHVTLDQTHFSFAGLDSPPMQGELELSGAGVMRSLSLHSPDRRLYLQARPLDDRLSIAVEGLGWRPAKDSPYAFDSLSVKGEIRKDALVLDSMDLRLFDGTVVGAAVLHADGQPTITGTVSFERINARQLTEAFGLPGQLAGDGAGKLRFAATSRSWLTLFDALYVDGEVTLSRGTLGRIDLPEAVRRASPTPLALGGSTRFEQLSGTVTQTPNGLRFSRVALSAGLMQSTGQIEVDRDRKLRGRMDVQMRGRADHTAMSIVIGGTLQSPLLHALGP